MNLRGESKKQFLEDLFELELHREILRIFAANSTRNALLGTNLISVAFQSIESELLNITLSIWPDASNWNSWNGEFPSNFTNFFS